MVLVTVRVFPFLLTVVLIRWVTLFVSTFGVRSYRDQRYSSTQISSTRHSSRISTGRAAGCRYSAGGSDVNRDTSRVRVSGGGRESVEGASTAGTSVADTPARTNSVTLGAGSSGASGAGTPADATAPRSDVATASAATIAGFSSTLTFLMSALAVVASRAAPGGSIPNHSGPPNLAAYQPARTTVPHNNSSANCRDLSTRSPPPSTRRKHPHSR